MGGGWVPIRGAFLRVSVIRIKIGWVYIGVGKLPVKASVLEASCNEEHTCSGPLIEHVFASFVMLKSRKEYRSLNKKSTQLTTSRIRGLGV